MDIWPFCRNNFSIPWKTNLYKRSAPGVSLQLRMQFDSDQCCAVQTAESLTTLLRGNIKKREKTGLCSLPLWKVLIVTSVFPDREEREVIKISWLLESCHSAPVALWLTVTVLACVIKDLYSFISIIRKLWERESFVCVLTLSDVVLLRVHPITLQFNCTLQRADLHPVTVTVA